MNKLLTAVLVASLNGHVVAADTPDGGAGSNQSGSEKVCMLSNASTEAFKESISKCKRGDIMALGGVTNLGAMQYCDFTKGIMYDGGKIVGCVYTGNARTTTK